MKGSAGRTCDFWSRYYPIKIILKPSTPHYINFTTIIIFIDCIIGFVALFKLDLITSSTNAQQNTL